MYIEDSHAANESFEQFEWLAALKCSFTCRFIHV